MKTKIHILSITVVLCFFFVQLAAQDDNDYTNNRGKKKQNQEAINTKKKTPVKIIQYIVGTWEVEEIYKGDKDITNTDTVGLHQTIEFNREGRFVSHSGTEKIDSGAYRLNENHSILYLESETGAETQEWNVAFDKNGEMTLRPRGTYPHAESFKYVYSRTSTANRSPN